MNTLLNSLAYSVIFDSSDEDDVPRRRPKNIRERYSHFEVMDDVEFWRRFRVLAVETDCSTDPPSH